MTNDFMCFKDRVCLVTGAGSELGIGFASAKILGKLGAKVALAATTDRVHQRVEELRLCQIEAKGYIADLTDRTQAERIVAEVIADFGKIDVLVNNAGLAQVNKSENFKEFIRLEYEDWDRDISRNLTICFNLIKNVMPHMVSAKYGRIVNISSITGFVVGTTKTAAYAAAKAGIVGMTRSIAMEVTKDNVMINSVLPGWIATGAQSERGVEGGKNTPAGRSGTAEEVANMVVFLASREASYITGQTFVVDGGNTIQEYKGPSDL
jgi:3-oxoacyl-[acyl-carrier protein] reductase